VSSSSPAASGTTAASSITKAVEGPTPRQRRRACARPESPGLAERDAGQ
jgi:hypothetical protein